MNSSQMWSPTEYKPGGTAILAMGPIIGRLAPQGKGGDRLGRWSYLHLQRKHLPPITIISVYQVCPQPTNRIGNTAWHQQRLALDARGQTTIHPRKAFIDDLIVTIKQWQTAGHDVIVGGDFNETFESPRSGILRLATSTDLVDPWSFQYPTQPPFNTHANGQTRIDIVLMSQRLYSAVKNIGYGPFGTITNSDHRPLFLDLHTINLFGATNDFLISPTTRRLRSNDRKAVTTYISRAYAHLKQHNAFNLQRLMDQDKANPTQVETVDRLLGEAGRIAEARCHRRRPEFFSMPLVQARIKVGILKAHLSDLHHHQQPRTDSLTRRLRLAGIEWDLPNDLLNTKNALEESLQLLKEHQRHHEILRQAELETRIQTAVANKQRTRAKALQSIYKQEESCKTYRTLNAVRRQTNVTQKLDRVEIPTSWPPPYSDITSVNTLEEPKLCTSWRTITNPEEIEYYLLLRNRLHFGQAQGTPFTIDPLATDLDWAASNETARSVLSGHHQINIDVPQCQALLDACKAATDLDTIPESITELEFDSKIRTWRESTTTSPSGRHLGCYKALLAASQYDPEEEQQDYEAFLGHQKTIKSLHLSIINYCIRHSHILERWKTISNVMIFKDPGNYKIHRLRVIHIYEADFNLLLAIKWRQLLRHADDQNLLHPGQFGGKPGCEAQSLTLLEELKYDLAYMTRRSLFNFDNDAASCYDRIIISLASLINRKYGQHRRIVLVHALTLQQAKFRLRTGPHLSATEYSHCVRFPLHGSGQGSGNSPCIWLFISSTLFDVHAQQAYGATFQTPDSSESVRLTMVGFVDDSTGACNDFQSQSQCNISELCQRMQHDAQVWNDLLYCSGGKLELAKCSFQALHFTFTATGKPVVVRDALHDQIQIRDSQTNQPIPIKALRADDAHKTLGHFKAPADPSQKQQLTSILNKARRTCMLLTTSPISRYGSYLCYHSIFLAQVKYPLPQSFFTARQLQKAESQVMSPIFAKCGFNRNTAHSLLYAPKDLAGGGFVHWYTLQGEGQIQNFLKHWRTDSPISHTLRITLAWAQWQSGLSRPLLQATSPRLPHLECRWLQSLRTYLAHINAQIKVNQPFLPTPERTNTQTIMNYALSCKLFSDEDLKIINYCRLYLHVYFIADLFNADGNRILHDMFHCQRSAWFPSQTVITLQRRPSHYQIRFKWQRLLREWSRSDGTIAASLNLGTRIHSLHRPRLPRQTYWLNNPWPLIYHWHKDNYWEYQRNPQSPNQFIQTRSSQWTPDHTSIPIDATILKPDVLYLPLTPIPPTTPTSPFPIFHDFDDYVQTLPSWEQELLEHVELTCMPEEIMELATSTETTDLLLISDGSQQHDRMSFGWVFGTVDGKRLASNFGPAFGTATSHRAEGWGMLSGAIFLRHLTIYTRQPFSSQCTITSASDNQGLITRVQQRQSYTVVYANASLEPDWDITEQIHSTSQDFQPATHLYSWVRGHQDNHKSKSDLPVMAQYNIEADHLANDYLDTFSPTTATCPLLPASRCLFTIGKTTHHGHYTHVIRHAAALPAFQTYLQKKYKLDSPTYHTIDWESFQQSVRTFPTSDVHILKLVHDQLPTRSRQAHISPPYNSKCHFCPERETFIHLLLCSNPNSQHYRTTMPNAVRAYCTRHGCPKSFSQLFEQSIRHWHEGLPQMSQYSTNHRQHRLLQAQNQIGWEPFLKGFYAKSWTQYLEHEISRQVTQTPTRITSASVFISGLRKIVWHHMGLFWKAHLKAIHTTPNQPSDKITELKTRIRALHERRLETLAAHRDRYFHDDVEAFLLRATSNQMRSYLTNYGPAIQSSIRQAQRLQRSSSVLDFLGFSRITATRHARPSTTNVSQEVPPHPSHTRWRPVHNFRASILQYLQPRLPTNQSPLPSDRPP